MIRLQLFLVLFKFSGPTTEQSKVKKKQSQIIFNTQLKVFLLALHHHHHHLIRPCLLISYIGGSKMICSWSHTTELKGVADLKVIA